MRSEGAGTGAFSVVVCTYNRAHIVGRAIRSVLEQTWDDFELIVVDDGSVDDTAALVASFTDPRVRGVHRVNGGLSAARNTGIAAATGRFIIFLDDDDEVDPDWLGSLASVAGERTGFLSCACRMVSPDRTIQTARVAEPHPLYPDVRGVFVAGTFAVDRSILRAVGGYDEQIRVNHQTELLLRVLPELQRCGLEAAFVDRPLVSIEQRPHTDRPLRNPRSLLQGTEYLIERHGALLAGAASTLADYHAVAGVSAARLGEQGRARRHFWAAVRLQPFQVRHAARLGVSLVPSLPRRLWPAPQSPES